VRRSLVVSIDICLAGAATIMAFVVRDNFIVSDSRLWAVLPYLGLTLAVSILTIALFGLDRSVWRFSSFVDALYVVAASATIVITTVTFAFALNRLDGVPRSIPVIQFLLMTAFLMAPRAYMRLRHATRPSRMLQFSPSKHPSTGQSSALIVGLNRLTELYLKSAREFGSGGMQVAGILGRNDRHTGRLMLRVPVLGTPEEVSEVVQTLKVHGVEIDRIIVTLPWSGLSRAAQSALRQIETSSGIRVQQLPEELGFLPSAGRTPQHPDIQSVLADDLPHVDIQADHLEELLGISPQEREALGQRFYWTVKRGFDVLGSLFLIALLAPVMAIAALLVMLDVGGPVLFWQQRPGLAGRPFRIYKLRTMRAAHDEQGNVVPENERTSLIGDFLRRTRLDELPQLFQILNGDMSFVGPRPLLPDDQPAVPTARLLVRPGLTGWAQVSGGRQISIEDKAALDLWYVRHASLWLDLRILGRTALMLFFGERAHPEAIRQSWSDVERQQEIYAARAPQVAGRMSRAGPRNPRRAA
jgi:lipopolysaccharide/colanic/teichoic acid biosynthesis glycosyltransferase